MFGGLCEFVHFYSVTCTFYFVVSNREIDEVYFLKNNNERSKDGKREKEVNETKCVERHGFVQVSDLSIPHT